MDLGLSTEHGAKEKAVANTHAVQRPIGKTLGLGIQDTWVHIFLQNGKAKKKDRLTDAEITKFIKSEFPRRKTEYFRRVDWVRRRYNRGGLTKGVVPKRVSVAYDK